MSEQPQVTIYTDGGALGNPGPGGYGVVMMSNQHRKELSGGFRLTTNNRMELTAVIRALESLKVRCAVTLYTDSRYVADAIEKGWAKKWRANGWMRTTKDKALNPDLWERLLDLLEKHDVRVVWVPRPRRQPGERALRPTVGSCGTISPTCRPTRYTSSASQSPAPPTTG